ncbi:MAG: Asp-tRNA(Asn)/Glu-tRNA(Gln) amidotransferase subunit GatB [Lentisphaeria bacterium]|nr:Asp-tRNA(Asn)/Glu-tRNA(Gln) amidotransferase subunit GatB [Lentisphaeria bacterium]
MPSYEAVIGLEVHVQARTESKMFCSCANRFGAEPNTLVCPVCMGYPGVLPTPNREAIRKIVTAGLMCSCDIQKKSKFDRKSYFYPDMPKNYQLTQYDMPFCLNGKVHISGVGFSGEPLPDKDIRLTRIHMEEDVAKLTHFGTHSGVDFNRAGVPLMEIVSEPDMRSPDEAYAYLTSLKQIIQYADISDCDMEKGQMRCDVNISLRERGAEKFGTKVELKNLNSFRAVHRAISYEIQRQILVLNDGGVIEQETRGWNDDSGESYTMRGKENAHDYRYFPEPDLLPVIFTDEDIENFKRNLPELPEARRARFVKDFEITPYDAQVLTQEKPCAEYFEAAASKSKAPKLVANWIIAELMRELAESGKDFTNCPLSPENLAEMVDLIHNGTINGKIGKTVFAEMYATNKKPADIIKEKGLVQVSDEGAILKFVEEAIAANPTQVQQYKDGRKNVVQFFVGQVMKASRGKANPQTVLKLLTEKLDA